MAKESVYVIYRGQSVGRVKRAAMLERGEAAFSVSGQLVHIEMYTRMEHN